MVAALIFAIFLIITFAFFDETFLIATLAYTILAFITAVITKIFCNCVNNESNICNCLSNNASENDNNNGCTRTASTNLESNTNNCFNYTYNRYKKF